METPESPDTSRITLLLQRWRDGDACAESELMAAIYPALRAISRRHLAGHSSITLSPTELVHEFYLRLVDQRDSSFNDREHFFAVAAVVIRRVLVDEWRERNAQKRGGGLERVTMPSDGDLPNSVESISLLDIDRLLNQLAKIDERTAKLVELRFFAGMSIEEAASACGRSTATAKRDWQFARAWLHERLHGAAGATGA